jgi:hypothetical protein
LRPDEAPLDLTPELTPELDAQAPSRDDDELVRALATLHGASPRLIDADQSSEAPPVALERDLLLRHAALYGVGAQREPTRNPAHGTVGSSRVAGKFGASNAPTRRRGDDSTTLELAAAGGRRGWLSRFDPLRTALLVVVLGAGASVAACAVPAEYEAPLGWALELALPVGRDVSVDDVLEAMAELSGSDQINVMLRREADDAPLRLSLQVWTSDAELEDTLGALQARVPALRDVPFERRPLVGTVQTSLAGELGFRVLGRTNPREVVRAREQLRRHLQVDVRQVTTATRTRDGSRETLEIRVERRDTIETTTDGAPSNDGADESSSSPSQITF